MIVTAEQILSTLTESKDLIDLLRQRRLTKGLTTRDVATRIGTQPRYVSQWERKSQLPQLSKLLAWFEALELELALHPWESPNGRGLRPQSRIIDES